MIPALQSALTGLSAFGAKMNTSANNIANANTEGFKKSRVLLATVDPQGVAARSERVDVPGPMVYEQTGAGLELVEQSNVDLAEELPEMGLSVRYYEANLKTLQVADEMLGNLLKTKA